MTNPHTDKPSAIVMAVSIALLIINAAISIYVSVQSFLEHRQPESINTEEAFRE